MYYIEKDIMFINGIDKVTYGFHYISRFQIDYVNNKTEIQISSSISKSKWASSNYESPFVNFYELDSSPNFGVDPVNYIFKELVTKASTVFYNLEVKKDYSLYNLKNGG